ncbi:MAG: shikimate dehydrogenase [Nanoarchaeota archaeon]|nr:shikimate dehydrogenase [Nanoarchaeota archaeon]
MIAVPIAASMTKEALKDMKEASKSADVIELRLDCIKDLGLEILLAKRIKPVIVTTRSKAEGGRSNISESRRIKLIEKAIDLGAEFVDVEFSLGSEKIKRIISIRGKTKVIVSYHNFKGTDEKEIIAKYEKIKRLKPNVIKIVSFANSIDDNAVMLRLLKTAKKEGKDLIAFCMGEKGEVSRILCNFFGSFLTFASLCKGKESAPGQLDVKTLKGLYRVNEFRNGEVFGLVGNPVKQSKGILIHNDAFKKLEMNKVYVNFLVEDLSSFVKSFRKLIKGFSVTIPFKREIIKLIDGVDLTAGKIGAVNTVINENGKLIGYNTDVKGAINVIESKMKIKNKRVLMIGAGGVARAIGYGVKGKGGRLIILNRTVSRAKSLGNELKCEYGGLDKLNKIDKVDIIVNATSIGMVPKVNEMPLGKDKLRRIIKKGALVFDSVYNPRKTKLLKEAEKLGCNTADGYDMFINQADEQFKLFTGRRLI